ncbi:MAG: NAD-dependent epimerase/dehydratase family protein [Dehalococcoidia bacterium]
MNARDTASDLPARLAGHYAGRSVLVTGGLGFIGSTVARRLAVLGARVTVLDNLNPGQGGNPANLADLGSEVEVVIGDQADAALVAELVRGRAAVFNLCGRVAHMDSLRDPFGDLHANCTAQLTLLEAVRRETPDTPVIYAGTRSQYGRTQTLPVTEDHPQLPADINGANKAAAERYHAVYHTAHGMHTVILRLTNIYGPRQLMAHGRQGFMNWFMRRAMDGEEILVFGDGTQLRDMLYVDDAAEAFVLAPLAPDAAGRAFNIASGVGVGVRRLAEATVAAAGRGSVRTVEYPTDQRPIEVGDFVADIAAARASLGWRPTVALDDGLARTVAYFASRRDLYWHEPVVKG